MQPETDKLQLDLKMVDHVDLEGGKRQRERIISFSSLTNEIVLKLQDRQELN